jgi:hyaluronan synthase
LSLPRQQQTAKYREVDKKRWFVRYLILAAVATVLALKIYWLLFVVDVFVGLYSVLTSVFLFSVLFLAYVKFRDPYLDARHIVLSGNNGPLITIVVPVKNEEDNIRNCVQSCINSTYQRKEIIIVNDGSTDKTPEILDELRRENSNLKIIHLSKSVGKKQAIEVATEVAKGEIYFFMDSDCDMVSDAVENAVKIFLSDNKIGAVTSHGRVKGTDASRNILLKMQGAYIDGSCRLLKGSETTYSSLTCCSGSLSAYRRAAVQPIMHAWAHDRFVGIEFKFATDRRMTAYVLGAKPPESDKKDKMRYNNNDKVIPILQTGQDDLDSMRSSSDPDVETQKKSPKSAWRVLYSPSVRVNVGVPQTFSALIRQQIRWRKSFIRSIFSTGGIYWKRPMPAPMIYYLMLSLKLMRPVVLVKALFFLPLSGDYITSFLLFLGVFYSSMIYGVDFRLRNPGSDLWLYRPVFTFLSTFVYTWLTFYAAITIKKTAWR